MKRSKIVSIIADVLYECNLDSEDAETEADHLLTLIENAGMTHDWEKEDETQD